MKSSVVFKDGLFNMPCICKWRTSTTISLSDTKTPSCSCSLDTRFYLKRDGNNAKSLSIRTRYTWPVQVDSRVRFKRCEKSEITMTILMPQWILKHLDVEKCCRVERERKKKFRWLTCIIFHYGCAGCQEHLNCGASAKTIWAEGEDAAHQMRRKKKRERDKERAHWDESLELITGSVFTSYRGDLPVYLTLRRLLNGEETISRM